MYVHTNEGVCSKDRGNGHCGSEVRQRLDSFTIPRYSRTKGPDSVWDEKDNCRLVQAVQHISPELGLRILKPTDTSHVQLRECQRGFGVDILVECYNARWMNIILCVLKKTDLPPRTITGSEVNTKLYRRTKVYWYRYVASKLLPSSINR